MPLGPLGKHEHDISCFEEPEVWQTAIWRQFQSCCDESAVPFESIEEALE